jgi:hypothetical protein
MKRLLIVLPVVALLVAAIPGPFNSGEAEVPEESTPPERIEDLPPGSTYHIVFATSLLTDIDSTPAVPPSFPSFGGLDAADWLVTFAAFNAGRVPDWDGVATTWTAILSSDSVNARDRVTISGPVYNTNGDLVANGFSDFWSASADPLSATSFSWWNPGRNDQSKPASAGLLDFLFLRHPGRDG